MPSFRFASFFLFIIPLKANVFRFYLQPPAVAQVTQLVEGKIDRIQQGSMLVSSVTLIEDGGYYIIVDSPSATDLTSKEKMLKGLMSRNLVPGQIQLILTTHGHPDHFGQGNFFPNARHFFASYEYTGTTFLRTELYQAEVMKLTKNTELWNTPGHTSQDISIIVRNTKCCGTVAVVGDLFYTENDALDSKEWDMDAWDKVTGHVNRRRVLCAVDWIVPGHGKMFKVNDEMRKTARCESPVTRPTWISITQPALKAPVTLFSATIPTKAPTNAVLESNPEQTMKKKMYPSGNSILSESESAEKKSQEVKEQSLATTSTKTEMKAVTESMKEKPEASAIAQLPQAAPPELIKTTLTDKAEMAPVTAAQDITRFQGTANEADKNNSKVLGIKISSSNAASSTIRDDEHNQNGELAGTIIFPTQTSPSSIQTHFTHKNRVSEAVHGATVKRFDKQYNDAKAALAKTRAEPLALKKTEQGILPALEKAASQIAQMFNEKVAHTPPAAPYMKMLQSAFNKLMLSGTQKTVR